MARKQPIDEEPEERDDLDPDFRVQQALIKARNFAVSQIAASLASSSQYSDAITVIKQTTIALTLLGDVEAL